MARFHHKTIKIVSIITLAAFALTNTGMSYAYKSPSNLRQISAAQANGADKEIAGAILVDTDSHLKADDKFGEALRAILEFGPNGQPTEASIVRRNLVALAYPFAVQEVRLFVKSKYPNANVEALNIAITLHGSTAKGLALESSDLDIGILIDDSDLGSNITINSRDKIEILRIVIRLLNAAIDEHKLEVRKFSLREKRVAARLRKVTFFSEIVANLHRGRFVKVISNIFYINIGSIEAMRGEILRVITASDNSDIFWSKIQRQWSELAKVVGNKHELRHDPSEVLHAVLPDLSIMCDIYGVNAPAVGTAVGRDIPSEARGGQPARADGAGLFSQDELTVISERCSALADVYPKLSIYSRGLLLEPDILVVLVGIKPVYVIYTDDIDVFPLFDEMQQIIDINRFDLLVKYPYVVSMGHFRRRMRESGRFLVKKSIITEDIMRLLGAENYGDRNFQELINILNRYAGHFGRLTPGREEFHGFLCGYPLEDIDYVLEHRGSLTPEDVLTSAYGFQAISETKEDGPMNRVFERWDTALDYAYAALSSQPGFEIAMPRSALKAYKECAVNAGGVMTATIGENDDAEQTMREVVLVVTDDRQYSDSLNSNSNKQKIEDVNIVPVLLSQDRPYDEQIQEAIRENNNPSRIYIHLINQSVILQLNGMSLTPIDSIDEQTSDPAEIFLISA